jgi:protocatechuate 3,4-dioxygenase beta subunit
MTFPDPCTRRRFLSTTLTVATALELRRAAFALGFSTQSEVCTLSPRQEVGPYYVKDEMLRSDITESRPGVPLSLKLVILDARTCKPIQNAAVDLWHCDVLGVYSGYTNQNPMGPGGPPPGGPPPEFGPQERRYDAGPPERFGPPPPTHPTDKQTFLRGIQRTAADGSVRFQTVFPGIYMGRTNHVHFKVRLGGSASSNAYAAGHTAHTGQIFFPEEIASTVMQREPYTLHRISRTSQAEDPVFRDQRGESSVATLRPVNFASRGDGFEAELVASIDLRALPAARLGPTVG